MIEFLRNKYFSKKIWTSLMPRLASLPEGQKKFIYCWQATKQLADDTVWCNKYFPKKTLFHTRHDWIHCPKGKKKFPANRKNLQLSVLCLWAAHSSGQSDTLRDFLLRLCRLCLATWRLCECNNAHNGTIGGP